MAKPIDYEVLAEVINAAVGEAVNSIYEVPSQTPASMAFDLEDIKTRLQLPEDVIVPMLRKFANTQGDAVVELQQLVDAGDFATLSDRAHTLKGVSASLGIVQVSELAAALDQGAKAGDLQAVQEKTPVLADALAAAIADIERVTKL